MSTWYNFTVFIVDATDHLVGKVAGQIESRTGRTELELGQSVIDRVAQEYPGGHRYQVKLDLM